MKKYLLLKKISAGLIGLSFILPGVVLAQSSSAASQQPAATPPNKPNIGNAIGSGVTEALRDASGNIVDQVSQTNAVNGGGAAGACLSSVITDGAIFGTIAGLTAVLGTTGVPSFAPDSGFGAAFQSSKAFSDYIETNCLNPAARVIYSKMLFKMNDSVLRWATAGNTAGLLGGSTFVTDIGAYFNAVAEENIGYFLEKEDPKDASPFTRDIKNQLIKDQRNSNNGYTPDLAETILAADCNAYKKQQAKATDRASSVGGVLSNIGRFFGAKGDLPTNTPGYNGSVIDTINKQNSAKAGIGAFRYILSPSVVYAQSNNKTSGASLEGSAAVGDSAPAAVVTPADPCSKRLETTEDKQSVVDSYLSGQIRLTGNDYWDVLRSLYQCNNRYDCAYIKARNAKDISVGLAKENAKLDLANNNGNVGVETCLDHEAVHQSDKNYIGNEKGACIKRGKSTTGLVVADQTLTQTKTSTELLQKLASEATWKDLAKGIVTNLITNFSGQLINSANGILSFSGNGSKGDFTKSISALSQSSSGSASELKAASVDTNTYVAILKKDVDAMTELVSGIEELKRSCSQVVAQGADQNNECSVDIYNQNYKNDPTAASRLASNPIYVEISGLDNLKLQLAQISRVYSNSKATLSSLQSVNSDYSTSQDVNKEIVLSTKTGILLSQAPQKLDIDQKQKHLDDVVSRLDVVNSIIARLRSQISTANTSPVVGQ